MAEETKEIDEKNAEEARNFLFSHPYSERTIKKGLFLSSITFALMLSVLFEASLAGFPFLGLKFNINSTLGLQFMLWFICLAKLIRYLPAMITDLEAERERRRQFTVFFKLRDIECKLYEADKDLKGQAAINRDLLGASSGFISAFENPYYRKIIENFESTRKNMEPLRGNYKLQSWNRRLSIFTEGIAPLLFSIGVLLYSLSDAWTFLSTALGTLE